jgi:hypothetical protein
MASLLLKVMVRIPPRFEWNRTKDAFSSTFFTGRSATARSSMIKRCVVSHLLLKSYIHT